MKTFFVNALLVITALLTVTPLVWMISASLMPTGEATIFPPRLLPSHATITHYHELFTRMNFGRSFANSMIIAVSITMFSLLLNSVATNFSTCSSRRWSSRHRWACCRFS